jgi:hypothetical protein
MPTKKAVCTSECTRSITCAGTRKRPWEDEVGVVAAAGRGKNVRLVVYGVGAVFRQLLPSPLPLIPSIRGVYKEPEPIDHTDWVECARPLFSMLSVAGGSLAMAVLGAQLQIGNQCCCDTRGVCVRSKADGVKTRCAAQCGLYVACVRTHMHMDTHAHAHTCTTYMHMHMRMRCACTCHVHAAVARATAVCFLRCECLRGRGVGRQRDPSHRWGARCSSHGCPAVFRGSQQVPQTIDEHLHIIRYGLC